jgi:hypothetical protein
VGQALVLENRRGIMERKGRCSTPKLKEARGSMRVHHLKDLSSILVSNKGCKLRCRDSRLLSIRFNTPTSRLLALHRCHHKETTMHRILVLWDHATIVARLSTMLIGVPGSRQFKLQLQPQTRTSTTMLTTVQQLQQDRIKLMLT